MKNLLLSMALMLFATTFATAQIKVVSGGDISMGTTSNPVANYNLQVVGKSVFSASTSTITSAAVIRGNNGFSSATTPDFTWYANDQTGLFHPTGNNIIGFTINGTEAMRINGSKNLLLGTTNNTDSERLRVDGGTNTSLVTNNTNTGSYPYAHKFYVNNTTTKCLTVLYNSNDKFFVYGEGSVWAKVGYYHMSDLSLKENITPIESALDKVLQLRGVSYNFKADVLQEGDVTTVLPSGPPPTYIGLIAQEVAEVVPEVVATNDQGLKAVAYSNLVGLLIEAIKEQNSKITELEDMVSSCCAAKRMNGGDGENLNAPFMDKSLETGNIDGQKEVPRLMQNSPNPFNENTSIQYYLPSTTQSASLMVFDMQGKLLKTIQLREFGLSSITIHGNEFSPGMFLYSLVANGKEIGSKRMILTD